MRDYIKKLRAQIGTMPIIMCGASIIVENEKGEILLQLRADSNCWGHPGGAVEINEIVEDAAKRELLEEAGIVARRLELFGVFSGPELYHIYPHGDEVSNIDIVYICREYSGEVRADFVESCEVRFFPLDRLPNNLSPPTVPVIRQYVESRGVPWTKA